MPQLAATTVFQLVLLLSAVPVQYFISQWSGSTVAQRYHTTKRWLAVWKEWRKVYLNGTAWMEWAAQLASKVKSLVGLEEGEALGESPAIEVMLHENDQGFFGASKEVRSPRPPYVFLRVGEVVLEKQGHMVGVVVSWDPELRAPTEWVRKIYANSETRADNTPHYKVLFSGPSPSSFLVAYLPQTQLQRITGMKPDIPTLENYFTHFDGKRFVMQSWLREIYPDDEDFPEDEDYE